MSDLIHGVTLDHIPIARECELTIGGFATVRRRGSGEILDTPWLFVVIKRHCGEQIGLKKERDDGVVPNLVALKRGVKSDSITTWKSVVKKRELQKLMNGQKTY